MKPIHLLRYGLPGAITIVGVVFLCIGGNVATAIGVTAIGIAVMVVGVNLFARMTNASQDDRDREERAREHYAQTGRWPDSPSGVAGPAGLPLARRPPTPPPAPDHHDPGHRITERAGSSRRGLSPQRRPRRPG